MGHEVLILAGAVCVYLVGVLGIYGATLWILWRAFCEYERSR